MADKPCPRCGTPMEHQPEEPDVGIIGAWICINDGGCDHVQSDHDDVDDLGFLGL